MPLQNTSGNDTADAYGGGVAAKVNYIENYFQTWLRTGTGASTTVTTGLDASTNKALVWTKSRSAATDHKLTDTVRGATQALISDTAGAQTTDSTGLTAFSSTGYTIGTDTNYNNSGATYVDWEFVAAPNFFDVVTYTGTGAVQNIAHSLGSAPGMIIVKSLTNGTNGWYVYHKGMNGGVNPEQYWNQLNSTSAQHQNTAVWNDTAPTSTQFTVGTSAGPNGSGQPFIAYLFASNAGGFGLTGTDNVISCGSFTTDGSGLATVNLGYEPQMVMVKASSTTSNWFMFDNMRGWSYSAANNLNSNTSAAETNQGANIMYPTATGFQAGGSGGAFLASSSNFIYIAIRRGPMKVPTDATKVFYSNAYTGNSTNTAITSTGFPPDLFFSKIRQSDNGFQNMMFDKLRGVGQYLIPTSTGAEGASSNIQLSFDMTGVTLGVGSNVNNSGNTYAQWNFQRAPSFFDEVCYTGIASTNQRVLHNLTVPPELIIVKARNQANSWWVYNVTTGRSKYAEMQSTNAFGTSANIWGTADPTSTDFGVNSNGIGEAGFNDVAYLFATCAGVSKVGSYTGNGTTQAIACGFAGGARFVLIKRTDATGDWYVYDTARGMTTLTDPYLLINSTAAETATLGSVTTTTGGFTVNAAILAAINTSSATYIFLAIA